MTRPAGGAGSASALTLSAERAVPQLGGHVEERLDPAVAGIVDEDVEPAEQLRTVLDGLFGVLDEIDRKGLTAAFLRDGRRARLVDVGNDHVRAAPTGAEGDRTPQAACPACHQKAQRSPPGPRLVACPGWRNAIAHGV